MTTYYFIRHAEKEHNGQRDPHLTPQGKQRAKNWAEVLGEKGIDMIYCSNFKRTRETAKPLAEKLGIDIRTYPAHDLYNPQFQEETSGKTVLVVGHQDTTPAFVNRILGEEKYPYIDSSTHGNLYRVTIDENDEMDSNLSQVNF